jgi:hypothetical protein
VPLILLLLVAGVSGVRNAIDEWPQAVRAGQKVATASEMVHGIASGIALVGLGARKSWARPALWVWGAALSTTAGLASTYWGDAPIAAALAGAAAVVLLCFVTARLALEAVHRRAAGVSA